MTLKKLWEDYRVKSISGQWRLHSAGSCSVSGGRAGQVESFVAFNRRPEDKVAGPFPGVEDL